MKSKMILAVSLMAIAASCAKNLEVIESAHPADLKKISLSVSSEASPRVSLQNDFSATWDAGDSISVFVGGQNCKFVASTSGPSVDFVGEIPQGAEIENALVVYPYNKSNEMAGTDVKVNFPHTQNVSKICNMMAGSVCSSKEGTLTVGMKNVGGLVEFKITRNDITSVTVFGNNNRKEWMSGQALVSIDAEGIPAIKTTEQSYQYSSVVAIPDGETFAPGTYYVAVPAQSYTKGITVRMQNTEKKYASISGSSAFTVVRSHIKPLAAIDTDPAFAVEVHTTFADYNKVTASGRNCTWPFVEDEITNVTRPEWLDKDTTLTTVAEGYKYQIFAHSYVQVTNSSCQGFKIGKNDTPDTDVEYFQLPVIPGYGLTKASVQIGNYNGSNKATLYVIKNGKDTLYTFADKQTGGEVLSLEFNDPKDSDTYRITHNDTRAMSFRAIDCYYKVVSAGAQTVSDVAVSVSDTLSTDGTTATVNSSFECSNFTAECTCGIDYKAYDAASWTSVPCGTPAKEFSTKLADLEPNTLYYIRTWAKGKDDSGKVYSAEKTFVTRGADLTITLLFGTTKTTAPAEYDFWINNWGLKATRTAASDNYYTVNGAPYQFTLCSIKGYTYRKPSSDQRYHGLNLSKGDAGYGYIQFPAIDGMVLSAVKLDGSAFKSQTVTLAETVDAGTLSPVKVVGSYTEPGSAVYPTDAEVTISEKPLKNNTRYYLVGNSKDITLAKLTLKYEVVK